MIDATAQWDEFIRGNPQAFTAIVHQHSQRLFGYGMNICRDRELINDLLQDFFLDLWRQRAHLQPATRVEAYLIASFRRKLIRHLKSCPPFVSLDDFLCHQDLIETNTPELTLITEEDNDDKVRYLSREVDALSRRQREAVYLRYYQGLRPEEIGDVMKLSHQGVRNLLFRAVQKLRASLRVK